MASTSSVVAGRSADGDSAVACVAPRGWRAFGPPVRSALRCRRGDCQTYRPTGRHRTSRCALSPNTRSPRPQRAPAAPQHPRDGAYVDGYRRDRNTTPGPKNSRPEPRPRTMASAMGPSVVTMVRRLIAAPPIEPARRAPSTGCSAVHCARRLGAVVSPSAARRVRSRDSTRMAATVRFPTPRATRPSRRRGTASSRNSARRDVCEGTRGDRPVEAKDPRGVLRRRHPISHEDSVPGRLPSSSALDGGPEGQGVELDALDQIVRPRLGGIVPSPTDEASPSEEEGPGATASRT